MAGAEEEPPEAAALVAMVLRLRCCADAAAEEVEGDGCGAGEEEVRARFIDSAAAAGVARRTGGRVGVQRLQAMGRSGVRSGGRAWW